MTKRMIIMHTVMPVVIPKMLMNEKTLLFMRFLHATFR